MDSSDLHVYPNRSRCLSAILAAALLLLGGAQRSFAQAPADSKAVETDQKLIDAAKKDSRIMANLTYLSDIIGPRLTGSAALKKANDWTSAKFKSYGLENVHLEPWSMPAGWERGIATARIIEPDSGQTLILASMGWTPGTKGKVEGPVVVLSARNSKELAAYKGKLKNAIVLRGAPSVVRPITDLSSPIGRPGRPGSDGKTEPGKKDGDLPSDPKFPNGRPNLEQMQAFRRELSEFLRAEGAQVLLSDAAKPHGLLSTTGGWRGDDRVQAADPLPAAFVAHEHYTLLHRLATRPNDAKTRVEVEITNKLIPGPISVYNTVGEIRGSEKPEEFVIIGAHLDSWDLAQGTTDNGTGTCVVMEVARILSGSGIKPKRTIRFVLFTGEEQGLHGSKAYVQRHKEELPRISMALVHDTGTGKAIGIGLQGRPIIKPILDAELGSLTALGFKEINTRSMNGSDHYSFEQAGVPGFAFQQDPSEYRFTHHSQSDTLDKAREADLVQGAQVMAVIALRVADLPALLPRDKPMKSDKLPQKKDKSDAKEPMAK